MDPATSLMLHPGRVLLENYLAPRDISVLRLAKELGVSPMRIYQIVQGERAISPTMALRFAHYFGLSKRFWLELQVRYDINQIKVAPKTIDLTQYGSPP